jgi:hypothetical protein
MFINHSCDANCETSEIARPRLDQVHSPIAAGEEITYDYCLYDGGDDEAICNCGAKKCRGTMYSARRNPQAQRHREESPRQSSKREADQAQISKDRKPCKRLSIGPFPQEFTSSKSVFHLRALPPWNDTIHLSPSQSAVGLRERTHGLPGSRPQIPPAALL